MKLLIDNKISYKEWHVPKRVNKSAKHDFCDVGLCLVCPRKNYEGRSWRHLRSVYKRTGVIDGEKLRLNVIEKEKLKEYKSYLKSKQVDERTDENWRNLYRSKLRVLLFKKTYTENTKKTEEYIGCSKEKLVERFESLFKGGMSWDNHGKWEIDHIKPLIKFNLKNEKEVYEAMHYTNLQPLWSSENRKKAYK